jgi:hypothetical protein
MLPNAAEAAEAFNNARREKPIDCLPDFLVVGIIGTRHCRVISDLGRLIACFHRKYQARRDSDCAVEPASLSRSLTKIHEEWSETGRGDAIMAQRGRMPSSDPQHAVQSSGKLASQASDSFGKHQNSSSTL